MLSAPGPVEPGEAWNPPTPPSMVWGEGRGGRCGPGDRTWAGWADQPLSSRCRCFICRHARRAKPGTPGFAFRHRVLSLGRPTAKANGSGKPIALWSQASCACREHPGPDSPPPLLLSCSALAVKGGEGERGGRRDRTCAGWGPAPCVVELGMYGALYSFTQDVQIAHSFTHIALPRVCKQPSLKRSILGPAPVVEPDGARRWMRAGCAGGRGPMCCCFEASSHACYVVAVFEDGVRGLLLF